MHKRVFLKAVRMLLVAVLGLSIGGAAKADAKEASSADFSFVQLSDIHWGFGDPAVNPDAGGILQKTIEVINRLNPQPDFVVCTGDLTHTTSDSVERKRRLTELRDIMGKLKVKDVRFLPGEHDAALDSGAIYREVLGEAHYTFDHKGVHFIVLDNTSNPGSSIGDAQLQWLADDLKKLGKAAPIVVFTHRPLFDLYPDWDWATRDGARALDLLAPFKHVTVFYGHIHQVNDRTAGQTALHAARGLMYPLPAPGSVPKKAPVPWDTAAPYRGLGFRKVDVKNQGKILTLTEFAATEPVPVVTITARKFEFSPSRITLKKGVPVILELTTFDVLHGFNCPGLGIRADINPGVISRVRVTPQKPGVYAFHCDNFCGEGHGGMVGSITVTN